MKTIIVALITISVIAAGTPFTIAMLTTSLGVPAMAAAIPGTLCNPTDNPDDESGEGKEAEDGDVVESLAVVTDAMAEPPSTQPPSTEPPSAGFALPPAGDPRKASVNNPPTEIPAHIQQLYLAAGAEYRIPWALLAGIGMAETNHGRVKATSSAGAKGLMQFMPATFAAYGVDGDGDHRADINNDADSIFSAANYLTASGVHNGPDGVRKALFAYNRAWWYVNDVLFYAHAYGGGQVGTAPGETSPCVPNLSLIEGEIPQSDRNVGSEYRLTLATIVVKRAVAAMFPTITTIGGWRASSKISTSDHPHGKGLDVMIPNYRQPAQQALGDAIADYVIANHEVLKIKYVIWKQRSWSPQRPYWRPMANRGSDTDNHFDHVHISVLE